MQTFDRNIRRASKRASLRRGSISFLPQSKSTEVPWDILERLLVPFLFCHAAAIIISNLLHILRLSTISTVALFIWFALLTAGAVLFYHFIKGIVVKILRCRIDFQIPSTLE